jgi:DNA-binding protein HU-beta
MTKKDIVNEVAKATGIQKQTVEKTVEGFMNAVKIAMAEDKNIYLRGFGSFIVKRRAAKTAQDIGRGTPITIPEHYIPKFKPAKVFLDKVKNNVRFKA